jgi:hypothetical protein
LPNKERFFSALPLNQESKLEKNMIEQFLEDELRTNAFFVNTFKDLTNLILDGTSAVYTPWTSKKRKATVYGPKNVSLLGMDIELPFQIVANKKEVIDSEETEFIPISLENWRVDPFAETMQQTPFLWRRNAVVNAVKEEPRFINKDEIAAYKNAWQVKGPDAESYTIRQAKYKAMGIDLDEMRVDTESPSHDFCVIMEKWGDFYIEDKFYENHVLILANDATFLYFGENPYSHGRKPFLVSQYIPMPGTIYGRPALKSSIPMTHLQDMLANALADILRFHSVPIGTYLLNDDVVSQYFSGKDAQISPGIFYPVKSHDSIMVRQTPLPNVEQLINVMQFLSEKIRESTGGVPYASGGMSEQDTERTLGEVQILSQGTSTRFQNIVNLYEKQKLQPYMEIVYDNLRQYMERDVFPEQYAAKTINQDLLRKLEYNFKISGSQSAIEKNNKLQDMRTVVMDMLPAAIQMGFVVPKGDKLEADTSNLLLDLLTLSGFDAAQERLKIVENPAQLEAAQNPDMANPQEDVNNEQAQLLQLAQQSAAA